MNPSSLPDKAPKPLPAFFFGWRRRLYFRNLSNTFFKFTVFLSPRLGDRVIDIDRPPFPCESYHETAQSWLAGTSPRHSLDQTASPCNRTCPPIRYGDIRSVFLGHLDLVISRESIHKGQHPMSSGVVHQNIDVRKRKRIFSACLV